MTFEKYVVVVVQVDDILGKLVRRNWFSPLKLRRNLPRKTSLAIINW